MKIEIADSVVEAYRKCLIKGHEKGLWTFRDTQYDLEKEIEALLEQEVEKAVEELRD